jgi:hypothetical protein
MDDKLRELVSQATTRLENNRAEREAENKRADQAKQDADALRFKQKVESVLGKEVLDAIGPVTFHKDFLRQSMTFEQDSRTFRLQQQTEFLVELKENEKWLGHQFNLKNADSKDTFLQILGTALGVKPDKDSGVASVAVAAKRGSALGEPRNTKNLRP